MSKELISFEKIEDIVKEGCVFLEPKKVFNLGIIDYDEKNNMLVYSYQKLIDAFMDGFCFSYEEAVDWLEYNTIGSLPNIKNAPSIVYEQ